MCMLLEAMCILCLIYTCSFAECNLYFGYYHFHFGMQLIYILENTCLIINNCNKIYVVYVVFFFVTNHRCLLALHFCC